MIKRHPIRKLAVIYLGGVIGALIRVGLADAFPHSADAIPWPTLVVNMAGVLIFGYLVAALSDHRPDRLHHPLLVTGLCGTLTTFSAMQLELFNMVDSGEFALAATYLSVSLVGGFLLLRTGLSAGRRRLGSAN